MTHRAWTKAIKDLPTKSAKIRALDALGVPRAEIARFLDIRYQHVRNVLTAERPTQLRHVAETAAPYEAEADKPQMMADGSVCIPAAVAKTLNAEPGGRLLAFPQDGGLWIATPAASRAHAQTLVSNMGPPSGESHVDDFIEWRRQDAGNLERKLFGNDPR